MVEELKKKTNCELIQMILEIKPNFKPVYKLWTAKKIKLIKYYIKIKEGSK
jgi:hypothetical protein